VAGVVSRARYIGTPISGPDFVQLAEVTASRAARHGDGGPRGGLRRRPESGGPFLLDCKVEQDENVYPMVQPGTSNTDFVEDPRGGRRNHEARLGRAGTGRARDAGPDGNLFARRGYNVESFTAGASELPGVTRITIVVEGSSTALDQIAKQFRKLIGAVKVADVTADTDQLAHEMLLVKVGVNAKTRQEVVSLADLFKARIVDVSRPP